jgi:hypothetical protein
MQDELLTMIAHIFIIVMERLHGTTCRSSRLAFLKIVDPESNPIGTNNQLTSA